MVSIDGIDITGATIDGQEVQEITIDGSTAWQNQVVLIDDNFNDGNINGWTVDSGDWNVRNGELHQDSSNLDCDIYRTVTLEKDTAYKWEFDIMQEETFFGKNCKVWHASTNLGDNVPTATVSHLNGNSDPQYAIRLSVNPTGNDGDGGFITTGSLSKNTFHHVRVEYDGNGNWDFWVNGSYIGDLSFQQMNSNSQMIHLRYDSTGRFDNLYVEEI